jgi:hypothetical protein
MGMSAPACGRCGRVIVEAFYGTNLTVRDFGGTIVPMFQLCDSCAESLSDFLQGRVVEGVPNFLDERLKGPAPDRLRKAIADHTPVRLRDGREG